MGGMPMNLLKNKKHTEIRKETAPLKMKRGQKKLFALYAMREIASQKIDNTFDNFPVKK